MEFYKNRIISINICNDNFKNQLFLIEESLLVIDSCIDLFNKNVIYNQFNEVCGFTVVKAKFCILGILSLILDGFAQEAGALLRPLMEYIELLNYFRLDPNRIIKVYDKSLPSAGNIAKLVNGNFKKLREHLNENASHSSYSEDSLTHLIDKKNTKFLKIPEIKSEVLSYNLKMLFLFLYNLGVESINCLQKQEFGCADDLANKLIDLRDEGKRIFSINI
jgi:hypothetical protein